MTIIYLCKACARGVDALTHPDIYVYYTFTTTDLLLCSDSHIRKIMMKYLEIHVRLANTENNNTKKGRNQTLHRYSTIKFNSLLLCNRANLAIPKQALSAISLEAWYALVLSSRNRQLTLCTFGHSSG